MTNFAETLTMFGLTIPGRLLLLQSSGGGGVVKLVVDLLVRILILVAPPLAEDCTYLKFFGNTICQFGIECDVA